ncbi:MAG: hypothetical protein LUI07_01710, partial [Lachnospiraceae bacterium]|nr:hypothetical protein [Lachnospiraceae bacterium]
MKRKRRILSAILAFVLMFSLVVSSAFATETGQTAATGEATQASAEKDEPEAETETETETAAMPGTEAVTEAETGTDAETETEIDIRVEAEMKTEADTVTEAETDTETVAETEIGAGMEPETKVKSVLRGSSEESAAPASDVPQLTADEDTLPYGAKFYYQYVITDADYNAGAQFDTSYYDSVKTKIETGSYVANTIVGIELSDNGKTMTLYFGSAAGTEVNGVLQPYEETQPSVNTGSVLTELEGWVGVDLDGITQTLSSSYYVGSAVQTYYGQYNTTFTSSLKRKYGFAYTLTLDDGQSLENEAWYNNVVAAISSKNETGVLAIEKSSDGRTITLYFDSYDFYKTTLTLPGVTLTDTSNTVFDNAWSDGTNVLPTTNSLSVDLDYRDSGNTVSPYATDLILSPAIATKTYTVHINLGEDGSLTTAEDYAKFVSSLAFRSDASGYTVSKDDNSNLVISGVNAGDVGFSVDTGVIEATEGKMFGSFALDTSATDSAVSCSITCEDGKWQFTDFSSNDTNVSHDIYVKVVYDNIAEMYVDLSAEGIGSVSQILTALQTSGNSDITSFDVQTIDGKACLALTAREGSTIYFADILCFEDGYYTESKAIVGTDGKSEDNMAAVVTQKKAYTLTLMDSATGEKLYEDDVVWNEQISFDDPIRTGYVFLGWSLEKADADAAGALPATMPNVDAALDTYPLGSVTYYTNWQVKTYEVELSFPQDSVTSFDADRLDSWTANYNIALYDTSKAASFVFYVEYDADLSIDMSVIIDSVSRPGYVLEGFYPETEVTGSPDSDLTLITMADLLQYDTDAGQVNVYVAYVSDWTEITDSEVVTAPSANSLTYTGGAQALAAAGEASGGELYYSLTGNDGDWSTVLPTATDAGEYIVYYRAVGDTYHYDTDVASFTVKIGKAAVTVTANDVTKNYGDSNPAFTFTVTQGTLLGSDTKTDLGVKLSTDADVTSAPGTYAITGTADSVNYSVTVLDGTLTVAELYELPEQEFPDTDAEHRVEVQVGLSEVPETLQSIPELNTVDKITSVLEKTVIEQNGYAEENVTIYDVVLMISLDGGSTWEKAT